MAANKEAIAIVLDVGPSMNQAPPGEVSALQTAIDAITMILQRKMFSESKDEIALILFGTDGTDNPLSDGDSYENITIARPIGVADFDLLQQVKNDIQPSDTSADFLDALVVAMDHLVQGIQGKRGFAGKRIILLSDLGGEFGDDQLDTIVAAMHNSGTELNVIGPDIDDDDDENGEKGGGDGAGPSVNGHRKEKTPQQRAGEAMIKHILDQINGECYSFNEALPALSYFQARQVRPTAWKCNMEIGPDLKIPINFYGKIKDFKLKQSWKKVYAKDPDLPVGNLRTFHMNDEEETEIEREDMVQGYRYGNTLVPMSEDDKENMKYRAEKCLKVLGFTKSENVKRHHLIGDGTNVCIAEKGDEAAAVALSAIINALYETNSVAIARRVYSSASGPKLGVLWPHIKANYECLYWAELPFAEDVRQFTFGTLPLTDDTEMNKKYKPSAEQLKAMDDLITNMDLSQAAVDEDDEKTEVLKPKLTFNPYFQRLYQCLQHRAENTEEGLPELSPIIASYLKPPQEILTKCEDNLEKMKKVFKLEMVAKKKEEQTGEKMFKENEAEAGPAPKRQKMDDNLEGGMEDITRAKVTEVGTVTPIEDFKDLISRKDEDLFEDACKQMQKRIQQIVGDSFGTQFYSKAMDCLKALRQECIKKQEAGVFNDFMSMYKDTLIGKGRRDFWDQIVLEKQALISKVECEDSKVTKAEAEKFVAEEVKDEPAPAEEAETTDDLLDQLE